MNPNMPVRCIICGKDIHNGQPYETTKRKGCKPLFAHKGCIKYRKERKE